MATKTRSRSATTHSAGRFSRTTPRRTTTRKAPQSSSPFSAITNMLPGTSSRKTSSRRSSGGGKSKAGMAALAGLAGFAFKNRSRVTSRFGRNRNPQV